MQPPPGAFELLKVGMMQDQVDLLRQLLVQLSDDRLDRLDDVGADQFRLRERLLRQRSNRPFDRLLRLVGLRLEFFSQQRIEFRHFNGSDLRLWVLLGFGVSHGCFLVDGSWD